MSEEKISFSGEIMSGVKAAESALNRESVRKIDDFVDSASEDDPLIRAAKGEKSNTGTLSDLPEGHPILQELIESQRRVEEQEFLLESRPKPDGNIRHAKRLNGAQVRRAERQREQEEEEKANDFVRAVNDKVDDAYRAIGVIMNSLDAIKSSAPENRYAQLGVIRLERFLTATSRGLSGCRLRTGRS